MDLETVEVVSKKEHKYAEVLRPAGTRYRAEKRLLPMLVHVGFAEEAPREVIVKPTKSKRRVR